nr:ABC transporter substrate-binding protein [Niveibacterium umoris]
MQVAPGATKEGSVGWQLQMGAKSWFDEVNVRGGVGGKQIKLVAVDEGNDISAQTKSLIKEHQPAALFGFVGAAPVVKLVADKVLDTAQVPLVGAHTGAAVVAADKNASMVFLTRATYADEVDKVMKQLATIGIRKFVVFHSEDQAGLEYRDLAKAVAAKQNQTVEAVIAQPKDLSKIAPLADAVVAKEHQAVLLAVEAPAAAAFVKRYREQGGSGQIVGMSTVEGVRLAETAGPKASRGVALAQVAPNPRNESYAVVREFTTNYRKYGPYTEEPTQAMMEGYLAAKVITEGLKRAGGKSGLARGIGSISGFDVGGVSFTYGGASRSGSKYVEMSVIDKEGRVTR